MSNFLELAQTWLDNAFGDIQFAELGLQEGLNTQVCFMCQQAAEKALKAYLFSHEQYLQRTHVLPRLLQACTVFDPGFRDLSEACAILTSYYTDTRYPETSVTLDKYDRSLASEAVSLARHVVAFVSARVERRGGVGGGKESDT
jgi:HEPN domain-containing protein